MCVLTIILMVRFLGRPLLSLFVRASWRCPVEHRGWCATLRLRWTPPGARGTGLMNAETGLYEN